jgi:hypothetical protein
MKDLFSTVPPVTSSLIIAHSENNSRIDAPRERNSEARPGPELRGAGRMAVGIDGAAEFRRGCRRAPGLSVGVDAAAMLRSTERLSVWTDAAAQFRGTGEPREHRFEEAGGAVALLGEEASPAYRSCGRCRGTQGQSQSQDEKRTTERTMEHVTPPCDQGHAQSPIWAGRPGQTVVVSP